MSNPVVRDSTSWSATMSASSSCSTPAMRFGTKWPSRPTPPCVLYDATRIPSPATSGPFGCRCGAAEAPVDVHGDREHERSRRGEQCECAEARIGDRRGDAVHEDHRNGDSGKHAERSADQEIAKPD